MSVGNERLGFSRLTQLREVSSTAELRERWPHVPITNLIDSGSCDDSQLAAQAPQQTYWPRQWTHILCRLATPLLFPDVILFVFYAFLAL
jgi:hypothetical protein